MPHPQSILLTEPNDDRRMGYAEYLHTFGFTVLTADTTDDGLSRASDANVIVTGRPHPGHDDIGIAGAAQSVVRGVGGQDREPENSQVFRVPHASVVVGFAEQDGLRAWHGTCLSGTAMKRPSNSRRVR